MTSVQTTACRSLQSGCKHFSSIISRFYLTAAGLWVMLVVVQETEKAMPSTATKIYLKYGPDSQFEKVCEPRLPNNANFVICCDHGDWSGFRTLAECEAQFAEIESSRPHSDFWVEER
jgi:hypothetical protein